MNSLIQHPITEALGWTMIHSLWQITLLVLVYRGMSMLPNFQKAPLRYALGMGVLGLTLLASVITFYQVYEPPLVVELAQNSANVAIPLELPNASESEFLLSTQEERLIEPQEASLREQWGRFLSQLEPYLSPLALGWMLGIFFMGIRFSGSILYLRNLRREGLVPVDTQWEEKFQGWISQMGIKRPVQLKYSHKVGEPLTLGHWKPLVLIPLGLLSQQDPQQIEALLLHELAHIRRYDFAFNVLQSWVEILFFYHPAIWWISREVRESREHCCDDAAIAISNNPLAYAQALTQLQLTSLQPSKTQLTMSASGNTSKFTQRIYRIMGKPTQNLASTKGNLVAILAFLGTFFLAFQQQQFQEEQAMLDALMKNDQVDTQTLQNWLLFTIHPHTDQEEIDRWLGEVSQLSAHPFQMKIEKEAQSLKSVSAFKMTDQEERKLWAIRPDSLGGMKKMMLVYDPVADMLYMQTNHSNSLFSYNLETDVFAYLEEESLPFGEATKKGLIPMVSFQEQDLDKLPVDKFTIELTPQTTMDELLGWSIACSKLGMKLDYEQISFDTESGDLVKLTGVYQNTLGETMPFDYENFSFVMFEVDRNAQTIPVAMVATVDSSSTTFGEAQAPLATYKVHSRSSNEELEQVQKALAKGGIRLEWDHIKRNPQNEIQEIFGRVIYGNQTFRLIKIDQLNEFDIQVFDRQEDPVHLDLGEDTFAAQMLSSKPLNAPVVAGHTHVFARHLNVKKGPEVYREYGMSMMWYGSSEEIFQKEYGEFVQGLLPSSILFLNQERVSKGEFLQLNLPVDSVDKFFYRDKTAATIEYGKEFFGPVYQVYTRHPLHTKPEPNYIFSEEPIDTPLVVLDGVRIHPKSSLVRNESGQWTFSSGEIEKQYNINSLTVAVVSGKEAVEKYGDIAKNGAFEIKTKKSLSEEEAEKFDRFLKIFQFDPEKIDQVISPEGEIPAQEYKESEIIDGLEYEKKLTITPRDQDQNFSGQPLFILDGIEIPRGSLKKGGANYVDLDPEDIERINVLKGKAAEKKYGRKGENGVVEITTKLPEIIRLKISDFVLPNGDASATLKHSQKYDDILILRDWKESALSINGSLPEDRIDDLPFKKKQDYNALSQHHIHSIHSYKMNQRSGDKWVRFIYTNKAPEVLWRPSATGDYQNLDSKTQLFFLNMSMRNAQNLSIEMEPYFTGVDGENFFIYVFNEKGDRIAQGAPKFNNHELDQENIRTRVLSRKDAIAEFGTSGVTGLLVVSFDQKEKKMDTSLDGRIESPQTHPELYPFKSAGTQFPVSGIGVAPNPAQEGEVDIRLILEKKQEVRVSIFDRLGREVAFLLQKTFEKGGHTIPWSLDRLPAGYYWVVAQVDGKGMSTPLVIK